MRRCSVRLGSDVRGSMFVRKEGEVSAWFSWWFFTVAGGCRWFFLVAGGCRWFFLVVGGL